MKPDVLILGAGLAGCVLAWSLRRHGANVRLLDRGEAHTPSRIAAGLMTPVTGMRLALTWRMQAVLAAADTFYRGIESEVGDRFYYPRPAMRLFGEPGEAEILARKGDQLIGQIAALEPPLNPSAFSNPLGGFTLTRAARLDVPLFLRVTQDRFTAEERFHQTDVDIEKDIELTPNGVRLPKRGWEADKLIFCQGYQPEPNPWFPQASYEPAKGEILTVSIPDLDESRIIYAQGIWLAPIGEQRFRVGSTYDLDHLDSVPTAAGREELLEKLRQFVRVPITVIGHDAAVRPVSRTRKPLMGTHPEFPQLGYFNGLGSKGSLSAPYCAEILAAHLLSGTPIDPEVDVHRVRRKGTPS